MVSKRVPARRISVLEKHSLRRKTSLRRGHFKTGPKCKGAYRRTGLGCLRHRNRPVHGLSLERREVTLVTCKEGSK